MRVMITTDTVGGVWSYTQELVQGLLERGDRVTLISLGRQPSVGQQGWADACACRAPALFRFVPTDYKLEWMTDGHACFDEVCAFLQQQVATEQPEVFHSNQLGFGMLPLEIPTVVAAHSDVVSWWQATHGEPPPADAWTKRYREIVLAGLAGAKVVVTPTAWYRDQVVASFGLDPRKCRVIPNGRSAQAHAKTERRMQAVTAGRLWDEGKHVGILADVTTAMPVKIAGEMRAPGDDAGTEPVLALPPHVTALGPLPSHAVWMLYAESALYLATSRYEPFGLAPLEAALAGCAIVANDIPSFREVWGDTALYYARDDAQSLSALLERLARDPEGIRAAAARARERAERLYNAETMVDRYCELYAIMVREGAAVHVA